MQKLEIHRFGPIEHATIEVTKCTVLMGPQASGKSTLAKCIYFFKALKPEMHTFIVDRLDQRTKPSFASFRKIAKDLFLSFWGSTNSRTPFRLKYTYKDGVGITVDLTPSQGKQFLNMDFSSDFVHGFDDLLRYASETKRHRRTQSKITAHGDPAERRFEKELANRLNTLFDSDHDILFIPAGRSLITTLTDHLRSLQTYKLDYLLKDFLRRVNEAKSVFAQSLDQLIAERFHLEASPSDRVTLAAEIIQSILKGDYRVHRDGEKIYYNKDHFTYLKYASSGQQEAIWITHLIFLYLLKEKKVFAVIEEPEAHLFPEAQREMARLLVLLLTRSGNSGMIITHSPYILSSLNNSLYAHRVAERAQEKVAALMPPPLWLDPRETKAFSLVNGHLEDMIDPELKQIQGEMVDAASCALNAEYDQLFELDEEP